jgi:hypothetical protein
MLYCVLSVMFSCVTRHLIIEIDKKYQLTLQLCLIYYLGDDLKNRKK